MSEPNKPSSKVVDLDDFLPQEETKSPDAELFNLNNQLSKAYKTNTDGFGLKVCDYWFESKRESSFNLHV
jgi:hypothetical protein